MAKEEVVELLRDLIRSLLENGKKYHVETASSGMASGGMTCSGWHPGPRIAEIRVRPISGECFYLSLSDADGSPYYFRTEESTFDFQIEEPQDEEAWDRLEAQTVACGMNFQEVFEMHSSSELFPLFLILEILSKEDVGKNIDINKSAADIISSIDFSKLSSAIK